MKTIYSICFLLLIAQFSFSTSSFCPDPPANDSPCITDSNPPIDLTGVASHTGTTCCATLDVENVDCSAATDGASVWYIYTPGEADGFDINLKSLDAERPMSFEVYKGASDAGCTGNLEHIDSKCNITNSTLKLGNCFAANEIIFVKITTSELDEDCGDFMISITPASCDIMADNCIDLANQTPIEPATNPEFSLDYFCVDGCLDYACPEEDANGGCPDFEQMPTVWFQVTTDNMASHMFTYVTPNGNWQPIWSVYSGTDCDNLTIIGTEGLSTCSNEHNTPDLHQISVIDNEANYWISVTVDPTSLPSTGLDDGTFDLCVSTTIDTTLCLGEFDAGINNDTSIVIEVIERGLGGQSLDGPFLMGEEVTINVSFFYNASENGADWLLGFVPVFGSGWDLTNFDFDGNAPVGNDQAAQWYEEGGDCAPILQEPNPILCTYTNEDGNLEICNQLDAPCPDCPQNFMEEGDPMPSGYFWVTNGGNEGCDNDCSPGEGWGIGSTQAEVNWTFTLKVKSFDNQEDCYTKNDLSISLQTFSDGAAGCWEDAVGECILARALFSPAWKIHCESPTGVEGFSQEICHDGITDIMLQTLDNSENTINVVVEDNPNVEGEMNHTFEGGMGVIQDDLLNLTNEIQVVTYSVSAEDSNLPGSGPINEIEVTVYPEMKATFPPSFVCEDDCTNITPDIEGGAGEPYSYQWSTGANIESITVCPLVATTYFVTVEDAIGCMSIAEVQVDINPPVEILLPDSIDVIKDDNFNPFDPDYIVCTEFISGAAPFNTSWSFSPIGLAGVPSGDTDECFVINEVLSLDLNGNGGQYKLISYVTDFFGCINSDTMIVNVLADTTVSVFDKELLDKISINPNPSNDAFNISHDIDDEIEYTILDVMGREVERGMMLSRNKAVYLGSEPNGLYFIVFKHPKLKKISFYKLLKIINN